MKKWKKVFWCVPVLALFLIVLGTEGQKSANAQVRRAARVLAVAATLDFTNLRGAVSAYSADIDVWEAASNARDQAATELAEAEATVVLKQTALDEADTELAAAEAAATESLDAVNVEHTTLVQ